MTAAVALAAAGLAACGRSREPVRIGVVLPADFAQAALLAAAEINDAGGIRGRRLEIVRDAMPPGTPDQPSVNLGRAQTVLRVPLAAVVGHDGSAPSLAASPVYNAARVLQLVPTGTSRLLQTAGPWTLALAPNDSVEGRFIAAFVRGQLRARSVVLFFVNDEYGVGLRDGVREALAGNGTRVLREVRYDAQADLAVLLDAAIRTEVPDVVIVAGYTDGAGRIARLVRDRRLATRVVAGDGAHALPALITEAAGAAEGLYLVTFWLPGAGDSTAQRFAQAYRTQFGREPAARDAMAYDALRLVASAIAAVGERPGRVREYLLSLGVSRPRHQGVTGQIGFGAGAGPARFVMGVVRGAVVVPAEAGP